MPLRKIPVQVLNVQVTGTLQVVSDPTTGAVVIPTDSLGSVGISLKNGSTAPSGANVVFEGTVDGASWDALKAFPKIIGAAGVTSATAAGDFGVDCAEFAQIRVRLTAITAGSFAVKLNGTAAVSRMGVKNSNAVDLQATATLAYQNGAGATVLVSPTNPLPVSGGGGGGSSISDVLLTDATGTLYIARDNGTTLTYVNVATGAAYTPTAPIQVADTLADAPLASITDNTSTAGYVYFCEALPGTLTSAAAWRISRMATATAQVQWANGNASFSNVAANRAALAYS